LNYENRFREIIPKKATPPLDVQIKKEAFEFNGFRFSIIPDYTVLLNVANTIGKVLISQGLSKSAIDLSLGKAFLQSRMKSATPQQDAALRELIQAYDRAVAPLVKMYLGKNKIVESEVEEDKDETESFGQSVKWGEDKLTTDPMRSVPEVV